MDEKSSVLLPLLLLLLPMLEHKDGLEAKSDAAARTTNPTRHGRNTEKSHHHHHDPPPRSALR